MIRHSDKSTWDDTYLPPVPCLIEGVLRPKHKRRVPRYAIEHGFPKHLSEVADHENIEWLLDKSDPTPIPESMCGAEQGHANPEVALKDVFDKLSTLKSIEDVDDEYVFKPTERAFVRTKLSLLEMYDCMGDLFPNPRIVPDGEGGIVSVWSQDGRRVRLRFRATSEQRDYIYYQSQDDYDVEKVTDKNLRKQLEWLINA